MDGEFRITRRQAFEIIGFEVERIFSEPQYPRFFLLSTSGSLQYFGYDEEGNVFFIA